MIVLVVVLVVLVVVLVILLSAALLPRMESGERSEAPTAAGDSSSRIQQLSFSYAVVFAAVAYRRQRRGQNPPM